MGQKKISKRPLSESSDDEKRTNKKQKDRKNSEKQSKAPVLIDIIQEKDDDKSQ